MTFFNGRDWLGSPGASPLLLNQLRSDAHPEIPAGYFDFLALSDGGEGPLPVLPLNVCLDSAETMLRSIQEKWHQDWIAEGFFPIGGNGGGELIGFDLRKQIPLPIIYVDMVSGMKSAEQIAPTWNDFLELLGRESSGSE